MIWSLRYLITLLTDNMYSIANIIIIMNLQHIIWLFKRKPVEQFRRNLILKDQEKHVIEFVLIFILPDLAFIDSGFKERVK